MQKLYEKYLWFQSSVNITIITYELLIEYFSQNFIKEYLSFEVNWKFSIRTWEILSLIIFKIKFIIIQIRFLENLFLLFSQGLFQCVYLANYIVNNHIVKFKQYLRIRMKSRCYRREMKFGNLKRGNFRESFYQWCYNPLSFSLLQHASTPLTI